MEKFFEKFHKVVQTLLGFILFLILILIPMVGPHIFALFISDRYLINKWKENAITGVISFITILGSIIQFLLFCVLEIL